MTLVQLQYVIAVAESKNFTAAAEKSFVTQPTLSMQIQKLEQELNVEIFDRSTHPIQITPIGEKIITQAKSILAEAKKMEQMVNEEKGSYEGEITIGMIPTIMPTLFPMFYGNFKKKFPNLHLNVKETQTDTMLRMIHEGKLDFGIAATPLREDHIIEHSLYYEPMMVFFPPNHPLLEHDSIEESQLDIQEVLLLEEGHCFRNNVLSLCQSRNDEYKNIEVKSGNFDTLIKLSKEGFGITILPALHAEDLTTEDKKNLRRFKDPMPTREVSLVYHQSQIRLSFIEEFSELIKSIIRGSLYLQSEKVTFPKLSIA